MQRNLGRASHQHFKEKERESPFAYILSVSYDELLLNTRQLILHNRGHNVVSAVGFDNALKHCQSRENFDLFIVGHSIPHSDKESLIAAFRTCSSAPVIALLRKGEHAVHGADFQMEPNPEELLQIVEKLTAGKANTAVGLRTGARVKKRRA